MFPFHTHHLINHTDEEDVFTGVIILMTWRLEKVWCVWFAKEEEIDKRTSVTICIFSNDRRIYFLKQLALFEWNFHSHLLDFSFQDLGMINVHTKWVITFKRFSSFFDKWNELTLFRETGESMWLAFHHSNNGSFILHSEAIPCFRKGKKTVWLLSCVSLMLQNIPDKGSLNGTRSLQCRKKPFVIVWWWFFFFNEEKNITGNQRKSLSRLYTNLKRPL